MAALFDGQTDESEMGVSYGELDAYIAGREIPAEKRLIIQRLHKKASTSADPPGYSRHNAIKTSPSSKIHTEH